MLINYCSFLVMVLALGCGGRQVHLPFDSLKQEVESRLPISRYFHWVDIELKDVDRGWNDESLRAYLVALNELYIKDQLHEEFWKAKKKLSRLPQVKDLRIQYALIREEVWNALDAKLIVFAGVHSLKMIRIADEVPDFDWSDTKQRLKFFAYAMYGLEDDGFIYNAAWTRDSKLFSSVFAEAVQTEFSAFFIRHYDVSML